MHIRRDFANMTPAECAAQLVRVMDDDGIRIFTDNPVAYVLGISEGEENDYVTGTTYMSPHLLITGFAGSGKTSFINTVILSMIRKYKTSEELGLVLIGKTDELHVFDEISQLVRPVITDPAEAAEMLEKAMDLMRDRYNQFAGIDVSIRWEFNMILDTMKRNGKDLHGMEPMPPIVIVIDDLEHILTEETESSIVRIAQLGGRAGIHLFITASPSDVTPLMDVNFDTRLNFVETGKMLFHTREWGAKDHVLYSFFADPEIVRMVLKEPDTWGT